MARGESSASLSVDGATYISWATTNTTDHDITRRFFVDLYMDGLFIERWEGDGLGADQYISLPDWDGLPERVRLQPGPHRLKLVVDSTNLVQETDESDNVFESDFTWSPAAAGSPEPTPTPAHLPDLVPKAPLLWEDSLVATSYQDGTANGPLSVNVPTYVRYGFSNQSLTSVPQDIWVYLYLDDLLVTAQVGSGLLAEETAKSAVWNALLDVVDVTPGVHTMRLEVDPTNLVTESNEDNNTLQRSFTWGTGPVAPKPMALPTPTPAPPQPLSMPNLVPGWRFGWDGPIMISRQQGNFTDAPITVGRESFVDVVVHNQSVVEATSPYVVDLFVDNNRLHTFQFRAGMSPNQLLWFEDWDGLQESAPLTPGTHTLKMVIDPDNRVQEADETDNVFEKTFQALVGKPEPQLPTSYTDADLRRMLADLTPMLESRAPVIGGGQDHTAEVLRVADAGYYLLTGTSIYDQRVDIHLLTTEDYLAWIDDHYGDRLALVQGEESRRLVAEREKTKLTAAGLKVTRFGKVAVVIDAGRPLASVIGSLSHELGHMRQALLHPEQDDVAFSSYARKALQEAQAQQFERAFWLRLEQFTGLTLMTYPAYQGYLDLIDRRLNLWFDNQFQDEHFLGYLLQWLAALDDPLLGDMKGELLARGHLGAASALALYDHLTGLEPGAIQAYVDLRLKALQANAAVIRTLAGGRLVAGRDPDLEGSPDLREAGLLAP